MTLRVLCVSTDFPPHREGGYELKCASFVEHLRAHGHAVRVLTSAREGEPPDPRGFVRRELVRFPVAPQRTRPAAAWRAERLNAAALRRAIRAFRPDVVSWWRLGEVSMSLVERASLPAVGMICDPWMLEGPSRDPWARLRGRRPAFGAAARWLFVSEALRGQVRAAGVTLPRSEVVHEGIELPRFPLAPARPWGWRLLYAGRLSPLKGVDTAIGALAHLPGMARLEIVGAGDAGHLASLRALAKRLGVERRVRFPGPAPPAAMAERYAAADVVLFPVRWAEPFGRVPLEAMATGTPVVATGTGGSADYLRDGANALLARPDDPPALAAAVTRLAADPRLRRRLRGEGRATAEAHPIDRAHAVVRERLEEAAEYSARR